MSTVDIRRVRIDDRSEDLGEASEVVPPSPAQRHAAQLVAVCGVCGGAGASTLTYLLARYAAELGQGPALACDTGGPSGGLALCAQTVGGLTLLEAATLSARGAVTDAALWTASPTKHGGELRVIAAPPRLGPAGDASSFAAVLDWLRHDVGHVLVAVDCGTLQRPPDRLAMRLASHVAWVLPASARGVACAERLFSIVPTSAATELVVARRVDTKPPARLTSLAELAAARAAPLVQLPDLPHALDRAVATAAVSLQAILGCVQR